MENLLMQLKDLGMASILGLAAIGSGLGAGAAGMAAVGAWKKAFIQNKPASFIMLAFVGAPLTQTIYGMIVMNKMAQASAQNGLYFLSIGIFCGSAMGVSAWMQGKAGACAADAMGETGKGFGNYLVVLGVVETVALFVMTFSLVLINRLLGA